MASNKNVDHQVNALAASGLSGKSVTGLSVFNHGSVTVISITYSTGSQLIKVNKGDVELGGDHDWGTGTLLRF